MCVGSSAWGGSGKNPGEWRAPPLASTPSLIIATIHISLQKQWLDFVWLITYGHHCTVDLHFRRKLRSRQALVHRRLITKLNKEKSPESPVPFPLLQCSASFLRDERLEGLFSFCFASSWVVRSSVSENAWKQVQQGATSTAAAVYLLKFSQSFFFCSRNDRVAQKWRLQITALSADGTSYR